MECAKEGFFQFPGKNLKRFTEGFFAQLVRVGSAKRFGNTVSRFGDGRLGQKKRERVNASEEIVAPNKERMMWSAVVNGELALCGECVQRQMAGLLLVF